jgi:serine/threonine-protein kinase
MALKHIGRYQVKSELDRGGMSVVYLAHDPRVQRDVAIKMLPRDVRDQPNVRKRFEREARTIAALEHPCIVPIYDFGEEDRQPYLVMRYMTGGSLADRLNRRTSLAQAARIVSRIASGLDEAHAKGVVHRDLKPGNILFDANDQAFLSDFGIVKITETGQTSSATGTLVLGTPAYMSPEQALGKPIDRRSDIYALGAVLYEMLTGMPPYTGPTGMSVAMKHVVESTPDVMERRPDLPVETQAVIAKAMAKEADARYANAGELAAALNAVVQAHPQLAAQMPEVIDLPRESPAPPTDTEETELPNRIPQEAAQAEQTSSRRQIIGGAVLALALVLIGLVGTLALTGQFSSPSPTVAPVSPTTAPPQVTATTAEQPSPVAAVVEATTETPTEAPSTDTPTEPTATSAPNNGAVRVQVRGNMRSGPSTGFAVVATNVDAEAVAFTQVGREVWYQVRLEDGRTGWAISSVVQAEDSTDEAALERLPEATDVPPTPVVIAPTRAPTIAPPPTVAILPTNTPFVSPTLTASPTLTQATVTPFPTITVEPPTVTPIP